MIVTIRARHILCHIALFVMYVNGAATLKDSRFKTNPRRASHRGTPANAGANQPNQLLYILIDGFRHDYVDVQPPDALPGFNKFLKEGARVEYQDSIFPSISYPAWTSLVTGLWAESHGIVGNVMYDSVDKDDFELFDADKTGKMKWWSADPVWTTATNAGLGTAVIMWSRCDIPYEGIVPDYCEPFVTVPGLEYFRNKMNTALDKLDGGADFVMLYTDYIDHAGHKLGPETSEMRAEIQKIDAEIVYLLQEVKNRKLDPNLNIVIVSDHGMLDISPGKMNRVELDEYLLVDLVEMIVDSGAFSNIKVMPGHLEVVYDKLRPMPGVKVYKHADIPDKLHYRDHRLIYDLIIKADRDTLILPTWSKKQMPPRTDDSWMSLGAHGWFSKEVPEVRGILFARGPDFKTGGTIVPGVEMVDVYPLLCHVLRMQGRPNNGTFERVKPLLNEKSLSWSVSGADRYEVSLWLGVTLLGMISLIVG